MFRYSINILQNFISFLPTEFSRGLPGTKYDFKLYYSNSSVADYLTWTASITTAPDPPSNLSIGN